MGMSRVSVHMYTRHDKWVQRAFNATERATHHLRWPRSCSSCTSERENNITNLVATIASNRLLTASDNCLFSYRLASRSSQIDMLSVHGQYMANESRARIPLIASKENRKGWAIKNRRTQERSHTRTLLLFAHTRRHHLVTRARRPGSGLLHLGHLLGHLGLGLSFGLGLSIGRPRSGLRCLCLGRRGLLLPLLLLLLLC